jgi:hypothetical protein
MLLHREIQVCYYRATSVTGHVRNNASMALSISKKRGLKKACHVGQITAYVPRQKDQARGPKRPASFFQSEFPIGMVALKLLVWSKVVRWE